MPRTVVFDSPRLDSDARPRAAAEPVIVADQVWKGYPRQTDRLMLKHDLKQLMRRLKQRGGETAGAGGKKRIWALRDVSFTVQPGESVAVIGRNGSGKSTLFKVLCGITRPTLGDASVSGHFSAMIALGAGFNRERTGRENIYLNAAIHGWEPKQIQPVIDDIIEFAEIGEAIDWPVKRYSSGMGPRLGFSIAVHIAPDTLFIDEALSVGDAGFREKCLERVLEMKAQGRTIMFVSHSAEMVRLLCERSIWLHQGKLRLDGPTTTVLDAYTAMLEASQDEGHGASGRTKRIRNAIDADVDF